ncbi:MAG: RNA 2',3'-cyclic phosphodiesterase [Gemmatimonadota bacterium]
MRLFAAIPLAGGAAPAAVEVMSQLAGLGWPVRWTRPEQLHLTLKFFGEVSADGAAAIESVLRDETGGVSMIPMELTHLGAFPNPRRARVIWLGLSAPAELERLQHRLEQRWERLGFPGDGRPFQPHVTLGRVRDGARLPAGAARRFGQEPMHVGFLGAEVVLYESRPGPEGARHQPLASITLGHPQ